MFQTICVISWFSRLVRRPCLDTRSKRWPVAKQQQPREETCRIQRSFFLIFEDVGKLRKAPLGCGKRTRQFVVNWATNRCCQNFKWRILPALDIYRWNLSFKAVALAMPVLWSHKTKAEKEYIIIYSWHSSNYTFFGIPSDICMF